MCILCIFSNSIYFRSLGNGTSTCLGMGGSGVVAALYPHIQRYTLTSSIISNTKKRVTSEI